MKCTKKFKGVNFFFFYVLANLESAHSGTDRDWVARLFDIKCPFRMDGEAKALADRLTSK